MWNSGWKINLVNSGNYKTYFQITELKIESNPFAKGFRDCSLLINNDANLSVKNASYHVNASFRESFGWLSPESA